MGNNLLPFCVLACSYMGKLIVQSQVYGKTKYTAKVCNLVIENITFSYMVSHIGIILGDVMDFFQIMLHLVVFSISFSLIFLKYKQITLLNFRVILILLPKISNFLFALLTLPVVSIGSSSSQAHAEMDIKT